MRQRERFRQMLREPGIEMQPAVYDALGARIAEDVGFNLIGLGGYAVGAHLATTEPLASLDDMARITRQISLICSLPIMVDAGAGWGEPLHVMHTVRVLEQAGAASIHLEDQYFPKRVQYHRGVEEVISTEEMVLKLRAALQARRDPDFAIVARSDAMRTHDYDEGIRRGRAYMEAGADAVLLFPNNEDETKAAPKDLPGVPLVYVNSTGNRFGRGVFPAQQLGEWGWKIVFDAISCTNVTAHAMKSYLSTLKQTGESGLDPEQVRAVRLEVERIIGLNELYDLGEGNHPNPGVSADRPTGPGFMTTTNRTEETMKRLFTALAAAATLVATQLPAHSQSGPAYPEQGKTVRLMVGFGAGGGTDIAARLLAQALEAKLGGNVIVENFPGGGGLQAVNRLVAAKPDGYTLALVPLPATNMLYLDPERGGKFSLQDVAPVSMHDYGPVAIAVATSSRWQTLDDLVKEAKEKPNTLTAASNGALAAGHLGLLRFNQAAGIRMRWTPVEQPGMLLSNVIGGHIDVITDTFSELYPAQQSKDLRILAVLADERQAEFPDVPTARDSKIDAVVTTNRVVIAPKGTPAEIVQKLDTSIQAITADPAYQKEAAQRKVQLKYLNAAQTAELWKGFDETFTPLVKEFRAQR